MCVFSQWKIKQQKPGLTEQSVNNEPVFFYYIQCVNSETIII